MISLGRLIGKGVGICTFCFAPTFQAERVRVSNTSTFFFNSLFIQAKNKQLCLFPFNAWLALMCFTKPRIKSTKVDILLRIYNIGFIDKSICYTSIIIIKD